MMIQEVLRKMVAAKKGQIVNIASVAGKLATPYRSTYAASKLGLIGYFDSVRAEVISPFTVMNN